MKKIATLLVSLFLFIPALSHAWGFKGHRLSGLIAEKQLLPATKDKLKKIIGHTDLAKLSTWADEVRSGPNKELYAHLSPLHYVNIPAGQTYQQSSKNKHGDIIAAINFYAQQLNEQLKQNPINDKQQFKENLALMIHFIGDIHQPFHVGFADDLGGNLCKVNWFGKTTNLHRVWDTLIINSQKLKTRKFANKIYKQFTEQTFATQLSPINWVEESRELLETIYPTYTGNHPLYCQKNNSESLPKLDRGYIDQHIETVGKQLYLAGMRIAAFLNALLY